MFDVFVECSVYTSTISVDDPTSKTFSYYQNGPDSYQYYLSEYNFLPDCKVYQITIFCSYHFLCSLYFIKYIFSHYSNVNEVYFFSSH